MTAVVLATVLLFREKELFRGINISSSYLYFLLIILILVRAPSFDSALGGQDEGLYVHFSKLISEFGTVSYKDAFREELTAPLRNIYDSYNPISVVFSSERAEYTVPFYPLLPMMLASFGALGMQFGMLLIGVVHFILFYFILCGVYTDKRKIILSSLFIITQPHFIFFNKFPVGEMLAGVFVLAAVLCLQHRKRISIETQCILISLVTFGYLMVRMNFPLVFLFMSLVVVVDRFDRVEIRQTMLKVLSGVSATLSSVCVYSIFHEELLRTNWAHTYLPLITRLYSSPIFIFIVALVVMAALYFLISASSFEFLRRNDGKWYHLPLITLISFIAISLPSIYKLISAESLSPYPFTLVSRGWQNIRFHSLFRFLFLLGPIISILLLRSKFTNWKLVVCSTAICVWLMATQWTPWIPYQYYYSRYFVSEFLPILLLFFFLCLADAKPSTARIVLCSAIIYNLVFAVPVIFGWEREGEGFFKEIGSVYRGNILVVDQPTVGAAVVDGIRYYSRLNVFAIDFANATDLFRLKSWDEDGRLVFVAGGPSGRDRLMKICRSSDRIKFENHYMSNGSHIYDGLERDELKTLFLPTMHKIISTDLHFGSSVNCRD